MQTRMTSLFAIMLIFHFLFSPLFISSVLASDIITFSTATTADPYDIQLDFGIGIDVTFPSELPSGASRDVTVDIEQDLTTVTAEYEMFLPQERTILTPLGDSSRIYVATLLGDVDYYVQVKNARVILELNIEGNGTTSHSSLVWDSFGSKSFEISYTGSTASKEILSLQLTFKYVGSLSAERVAQYDIIIDKTVKDIEVTGDQIITSNIEILPEQPKDPPQSQLTDSDKETYIPTREINYQLISDILAIIIGIALITLILVGILYMRIKPKKSKEKLIT